MTYAQTAMYFSLWGRVRETYKTKGLPCGDVERHALHKKALGVMKSSKDFTNQDLDKVKATFLAIVQPSDLAAQLRQQEQGEMRKRKLMEDVRDLAEKCGARPGSPGGYLDGMARKIFGPAKYHLLDERQLGQLKGILQRRIRQIEGSPEPRPVKQPPGAHAQAAQRAEDEGDPF